MRNEVNRAHKAKKALRYLLILVAMLSVLSLGAQNMAQQPRNDFRSTSTMLGAGSTLPQAAVDGVVTTNGQQAPVGRQGHIRTGLGGGGSGEPGDRPEPWADPLGDATWPLALCMMAYVCVRAFRRKRA